jgi:hypothetical protein
MLVLTGPDWVLHIFCRKRSKSFSLVGRKGTGSHALGALSINKPVAKNLIILMQRKNMDAKIFPHI